MTTWTSEELNKIGAEEELRIAPRRLDGTLHNPVTIWVVRHDQNLYIRSYNGQSGAWFRAAQTSQRGRIQAGGIEKEVCFVTADPALNDQIDAAYRSKYGRYPQYVGPMVASEARETTIQLVPEA